MKLGPLIIALFLCPPLLAQDAATLYQGVNQAIEKGVAYLRTRQKDDGGFTSNRSSRDPDGVAALCVYAMRKSLIDPGDPTIEKALAFIDPSPLTGTYSTAVRILMLETLMRDGDREAILEAGQWLVDNINEQRMLWAYPDNPNRIVDISNTQYALLGLWAAERHGFETPRHIWTEVATAVMEHQAENGGFSYRKNQEPNGSMTTAGITILSICIEKVPQKSPIASQFRHSLKKAWAYLEDLFHPGGYRVGDHSFIRSWYHYYLYGLERSCAFADKRRLGDHDWYKECAAELVKTQADDGSWSGDPVQTSFALLFLRLTTFTTMKKTHGAETDGAGKAAYRKLKPAVQIPFVKRWLLLGAFDDPDEAGLRQELIDEADADPHVGGVAARRFKWSVHDSEKKYVDLGAFFNRKDRAVAYAFTHVEATRDTEALLWFGSDDGARIFVDGFLVHDHPFRLTESEDTHAIPLSLTRGVHRVLVKVKNNNGNWRFYLRFSDLAGAPLRNLVPFTGAEGPSTRDRMDATGFMLANSELLALLPKDKKLKLTFDSEADLQRIHVVQCHGNLPFTWSRNPYKLDAYYKKTKKKTIKPNPGAKGVLCVHPVDSRHPARIYRKVRITSKKPCIVARLSAVSPEVYKKADWVARLGVYDGGVMKWFAPEVISAGEEPSPKNWRELRVQLVDLKDTEILVVLECASGGPLNHWGNEHAFIDELSIRGY